MSLFEAAPLPENPLGRLRILSPTSGLRVSPLQLGALSVGESWSGVMGSMDKTKSFELLDTFVAAGGNFIDTANNYQDEQSEQWIGEWMEERGNRDQLVIATKYTTDYASHRLGKKGGKGANFMGNHKRSMMMSIRDSLEKLKTDWIDVLYLHWWDHTTSIEEVMDGLDVFVKQGKVLYLGISDSPAWVVAAANTYARQSGKTPFSVYQGRWNVLDRDFERDILPMAKHFGMALAPWDVLSSGRWASRESHAARRAVGEKVRTFGNQDSELSATEWKMVDVLEAIAKEVGLGGAGEKGFINVPAVAIAYVMAKAPNVFPIIGGRKKEQLLANTKALGIVLTKEQVARIEAVRDFDHGFPSNFIGLDPKDGHPPMFLVTSAATVDYVQNSKPVGY